MRRLIAAIILIAIALASSLIVIHYEKSVLCELRLSVEELCNMADRGEQNGEMIASAIRQWEEHRSFLSAVLKHADVDAMSLRYGMLQTYYENEEDELYIENCDELLVMIDVILEGEKLSFGNLF